jgi:hypothetical protein
LQLNLGLESPQAQDGDWDLNRNQKERKKQTLLCASPQANMSAESDVEQKPDGSPEQLLEIYEVERGSLPCAERLTPERRRQCTLRLAAGLAPAEFRRAVRRAAQTPFLVGNGDRGWRANFDWFVANDTNVRRVVEGCYDARAGTADSSGAQQHRAGALYAGAAPVAALCGVRVKPAALARIRARDAAERAARAPQKAREAASESSDANCVTPCASTANASINGAVPRGVLTSAGDLNDDQQKEMNEPRPARVQESARKEKAS